MRGSVADHKEATAYAYVGNIGCVRFPISIRKASGIIRGDRLAVIVVDSHAVLLEKLSVPNWAPVRQLTEVAVQGCQCTPIPEACESPDPESVTVGWSYVQLEENVARRLGFLPDAPVKLVGEPDRITVALHPLSAEFADLGRSNCPP